MYWDITKTLSHQCLFNMILGNRGGGKTYGFKEWAIRDFMKTGGQFVYLRRYTTELRDISRFWDDIRNDEGLLKKWPDLELTVKGSQLLINGKLAGFAMPLSTAKVRKSTSFAGVNKIGFDEFIIEKGVYHYLPDEAKAFMELYLTISRYRPVIVMFLANAITMTNPYFLHYDVQLPFGSKFWKKGEVLFQLVQDEDFIKKVSKSRVGKMMLESDAAYAKYAINNEFMLDTRNFIAKKTPRARHKFSMIYQGITFGVWVDWIEGRLYVSEAIDPCCLLVYAITTPDHGVNTMLIQSLSKSDSMRTFVENYRLGNVRFESIKIKNICQDIIKLLVK